MGQPATSSRLGAKIGASIICAQTGANFLCLKGNRYCIFSPVTGGEA